MNMLRQLVDRLCVASTNLREARWRHERTFGTLVPRVFMSTVVARMGACVLAARGGPALDDRDELDNILYTLQRGMLSGDREVRDVIALSLAGDTELEPFFGELKPLLVGRGLHTFAWSTLARELVTGARSGRVHSGLQTG
jgi:hypothetical protein